VEAFVGGVSDGQVGVAAMRYTNPTTHNITWQKAWFFLEDDVQVVVLSDLSSVSPNVLSVLDQRRRDGPYYVNNIQVVGNTQRDNPQTSLDRRRRHHRLAVRIQDDKNITQYDHVSSLWHGGVGYAFDMWSPLALSIQTGEKTGNWSALGISTQPPTTVDFFTAWIDQPKSNTFAYTVFPGTTMHEFSRKALVSASKHNVIQNDRNVSAILDKGKDTAFVVFWDSAGGSVLIPPCWDHPAIILSADANSAIIYKIDDGTVTVSDPSQNKTSVTVQLEVLDGSGCDPTGFGQSSVRSLVYQLPVGGLAGSSVTQSL
jgi:Polysaccharide lyase family 8, super-sandwich domain/Polysaccharide lyase family 8, C-terminal beta-sandwich domain